jgi:hypothetical protein
MALQLRRRCIDERDMRAVGQGDRGIPARFRCTCQRHGRLIPASRGVVAGQEDGVRRAEVDGNRASGERSMCEEHEIRTAPSHHRVAADHRPGAADRSGVGAGGQQVAARPGQQADVAQRREQRVVCRGTGGVERLAPRGGTIGNHVRAGRAGQAIHVSRVSAVNAKRRGASLVAIDRGAARSTDERHVKLAIGVNLTNSGTPLVAHHGISFNDNYVATTTYDVSFAVEVNSGTNLLANLDSDFTQATGTSTLVTTSIPAGTGTIDISKTGSIASGPDSITYSPNIQAITVSDMLPDGGADLAILSTVIVSGPAKVPEPTSMDILGTAVFGLGLVCRRRKVACTDTISPA